MFLHKFYCLCKMIFLFLLLASTLLSAYAATTGSLNLIGIITAVTEITVTPQAVASSLNLSSSVTDLVVGSINEKTNVRTGYTVTVSSFNNGSLKGSNANNTDNIPYALKYGGTTINISSSGGSPVVVTNSNGRTGNSGVNKSVSVSYDNPGFINADFYSDILTFTIASNN